VADGEESAPRGDYATGLARVRPSGMQQLPDRPTDSTPTNVPKPRRGLLLTRIERVIHEPRLPPDRIAPDEAPISRIFAVIPIVTQNKKAFSGHDDGPPVIPGGTVPGRRRGDEMVRLPPHVPVLHVATPVDELNVGFVQWGPVEEDVFVPHLEGITRLPDEPLYIVLVRLVRRVEDYDIATRRLCERGESVVRSWDSCPINGLIHQQEITDEEGVLHGRRRNLESLDHKGTNH